MCLSAWDFKVHLCPPLSHPVTEREKGLLLAHLGFYISLFNTSLYMWAPQSATGEKNPKRWSEVKGSFCQQGKWSAVFQCSSIFPTDINRGCLDTWRGICVAKIFKFFSQWKFPRLTSSGVAAERGTHSVWNTHSWVAAVLGSSACVSILLPWSESQGILCNLVILN